MEKEIIKEIINRLYLMTKSKRISWILDSNTRTNYKYSAHSTDGITKFNLEISIDDVGNLNNHTSWWIYIRNKNLIDGSCPVYSGEVAQVFDIIKEVYNSYTKPIILNVNQSPILNDILNSLDKIQIRDDKIQKILTDKDI